MLVLAYEYGSGLSRMNLLVSFSAWAVLVWRYRLEVKNTVNRVRSLDRVRVKTRSLTPTPTLTLAVNPDPNAIHDRGPCMNGNIMNDNSKDSYSMAHA